MWQSVLALALDKYIFSLNYFSWFELKINNFFYSGALKQAGALRCVCHC